MFILSRLAQSRGARHCGRERLNSSRRRLCRRSAVTPVGFAMRVRPKQALDIVGENIGDVLWIALRLACCMWRNEHRGRAESGFGTQRLFRKQSSAPARTGPSASAVSSAASSATLPRSTLINDAPCFRAVSAPARIRPSASGVKGQVSVTISTRTSGEVGFGDDMVSDPGFATCTAGEARIIVNTIGRNDSPPADRSSAATAIADRGFFVL